MIDRDGNPWFVLADVCRVLELENSSRVASRLDHDERDTLHNSKGIADPQVQALTIVSESGLWSLVLTSRKPEAKRFKKWITSEVIPAIRKTGGYGVSERDHFAVGRERTAAVALVVAASASVAFDPRARRRRITNIAAPAAVEKSPPAHRPRELHPRVRRRGERHHRRRLGDQEEAMSSNEVIPFQFENRTIRMVELDGEVWFVASDIARELGYAEAKDLTRTLDADERGRHIVPTPSADQDMSIISEPGLYRAIVQRRATKRIAPDLAERISRFQRKVFHEVLPAIRKTGEYRVPGKSPARLTRDAAREARLSWKLATTIAASVGLKGNQLLIAANRYTRRVLGIDMLQTMGVPLLPAPPAYP